MSMKRKPRTIVTLVMVAMALGIVSATAVGQRPLGKKKPKKTTVKQRSPHASKERAPGAKASPRSPRAAKERALRSTHGKRVTQRRRYVPTRREYRHVRFAHRPYHEDGRLDTRRILMRSARVTPVVLERFHDHRRDRIQTIIHHFREGRRSQAIHLWSGFVHELADYPDPVDLDEIMFVIAKESCSGESRPDLFHARKLEFLHDSLDHLDEYIDQLYRHHEACTHHGPGCSPSTLRNIDDELVRVRAQRDMLSIEVTRTTEELESHMHSSSEYETRLASVFDAMYGEVELRIRLTP